MDEGYLSSNVIGVRDHDGCFDLGCMTLCNGSKWSFTGSGELDAIFFVWEDLALYLLPTVIFIFILLDLNCCLMSIFRHGRGI